MLRMLQVSQLALIDSLTLQLEDGFTCITGETGAGKSLLLDAVGLLLGARARTELVREGARQAEVQGLFECTNPSAELVDCLAQFGAQVEEGQLVITREVTATGRTVARVNGRITTVQALRQIGEHLVHQHGQHDTTALLQRDLHLGLLDAFGQETVRGPREAYAAQFAQWQSARADLKRAQSDERERERRIDALRFQIDEIEAVRPKPGEEDRLRALRARLQYAERLRVAVDDVYERVYEGDSRTPAILGELHRLGEVVRGAERYDANLLDLVGYLETARVNLTEAADYVRRYRDEVAFDPDRLQKLEDRLAAIERLLRKYGHTTADVLAHLLEARTEHEQLLHHDEVVAALQTRYKASGVALEALAQSLTDARKAAAAKLEAALAEALAGLQMKNVCVSLAFTACPPAANGCDEVEFLFSANPGEAPKPLARIASGGELSRVMLALIDVLSDQGTVGTLIFDEIDSGISGRAAQAVAQRIARLAQSRQVLCVTHLAQTASVASHHLVIEKSVQSGRTLTSLRALESDGRVLELARMQSGERVTDAALQHASEMLRMGREST